MTGKRILDIARLKARFIDDRRGNVVLTFAIALAPLLLALGMGVDYTLAGQREAQMDGIADAAALAAVTPTMMAKTPAVAQAAAVTMFNAQAANVPNLSYSPSNLTVTVADTVTATNTQRNVTVHYAASSPNVFSKLFGVSSIAFTGTSGANSSLAPRIDFYLMLDTSPSMAIAATQAGIDTMVANTKSQSGCAFACHETNPAADNLGNPGGEDNYTLARNLGVPLRIDLVNTAAQNLMNVAATTQVSNNTTYRMAIYSFDYNFTALQTLTTNITTAQNAAKNLQALTVYDNSCLTKTNCNNDEDTAFDSAMNNINNVMPTPGNGTAAPTDKPQEVLFIVSDGVIDELSGGSRSISPVDKYLSWCTTVKNRGIRIAFLYTTYYPLPTNAFYNANIASFQSQIGPTYAQKCASPGLYFEVSTGGDISSAMNNLFQKSIATARLTQ